MHFLILTTQYGDIASFTFFQANLYELRHTRTHSRTRNTTATATTTTTTTTRIGRNASVIALHLTTICCLIEFGIS